MERPLLSMGELIDQLSIINIKMWHVDADLATALKNGDNAQAGTMAGMARSLNAKRADVREEINRQFHGWETGLNKIEYAVGRGDA